MYLVGAGPDRAAARVLALDGATVLGDRPVAAEVQALIDAPGHLGVDAPVATPHGTGVLHQREVVLRAADRIGRLAGRDAREVAVEVRGGPIRPVHPHQHTAEVVAHAGHVLGHVLRLQIRADLGAQADLRHFAGTMFG
jgi:hypothetical protein